MWYNYRTLRENAPATGQPRPTSPDPRKNALEGNRPRTTTANGSNSGNGANGQTKRSKRAQQTLSAVGALVTLLKLTGG